MFLNSLVRIVRAALDLEDLRTCRMWWLFLLVPGASLKHRSEKSVREHAHVQRGCGVGGNPVVTGAARGLVGGRADRGPGAGTWTRGSRVFSVFSSRTSRLLSRGRSRAGGGALVRRRTRRDIKQFNVVL